jgi:hypothetical protein
VTRALLALIVLLGTTPAVAGEAEPRETELLRAAQAAEHACDAARAASLWRELDQAGEGTRLGRRARARLAWLSQRAEGDYVPLGKLLCFQALDRASRTRDAVDRFRAELDGFPPGRVRREALAAVAAAYLDALDDPRAALDAYDEWLAEPDLAEAERQLAHAGAARARVRLGDDGLRELDDAGLGARPEAVAMRADRVGATGSIVALGLLAVFAAVALAFGGWRVDRERLRRTLGPAQLALGAWLFALPVVMASIHDGHSGRQMGSIAAACALAVLAAAVLGSGLGASGTPRAKVRIVAALAAAATLGAGFLAVRGTKLLLDLMLTR